MQLCVKVNTDMTVQYMSETEQLRESLRGTGKDYLVHGNLPAEKVDVTFEGTFEKAPVIWNACVMTMNEYARHHEVDEDPRQFIEINRVDGNYVINICLNVSLIDQAVIEKTIIMVRKYKRLHMGKHEYGARSKTH